MQQLQALIRDFQSPPTAFRAKPFWAWNGKLEQAELLRQVDILHEMGFGGFFMHSRTGLQTEYLGSDWFRLTDACAQKAIQCGMEPWIYDEDRWPSGSAGGLVTKQPCFCRKYLTLTLDEEAGSDALAVFAARLDGLALAPDYHAIAPDAPLLPGQTRLVFRVQTMQPQPVYNGSADVDRLNLAATERFLTLTHRQYAARCAQFSDLCGIFTDEPHRGMVFSDFSDPGAARCWSLPWTDDLPQEFERKYGQPLLPRLPELFLQLGGARIAEIKWQFMELLQTLFMTRYLRPLQAWAHANGKKMTGHFLQEDSLMAQAVPTGSLMRCYAYLDEPGIDSLTETRYVPWAVKQLESAARQLGKQKKLSELYGATGWQMSFQDYKYVGDWQVLLGVNVRCPHLSWYTMQGEAKRDYPGSFLHQATWYREHAALEAYFARLGLLASQGTPVCDTLVIHPVESLWYQIYPGWANVLDAADEHIQRLERQFRQLFDWLMQTQTDFDYGDEGFLAEHGAVETQQGPQLRLGQMRYRRVVVGGCEVLRASTLALLQSFFEAGGEVIFLGTPPRYISGVRSSAAAQLAQRAIHLPLQKQALLRYFRAQARPVSVETEQAASLLYLQLRKSEQGLFALLWNKSRTRALPRTQLRLPAGLQAELWDCASGARYALDVQNHCVTLDFAPGQERVLRLCPHTQPLAPPPAMPQSPPQSLPQPSSYQLDEPNVLVLDHASLWLGGELLSQEQEILELDRTLRRALKLDVRGGEALQPWARKPSAAHWPLRLRASFTVEALPAKPLRLALEPLPQQTLLLNGQPISPQPTEQHWVDRCFCVYELPVTALQLGQNTFELTAQYSADTGLEAMYLLGDFGVWFRSGVPTLGKLLRTLRHGDLTRQGLPFYGGRVTYGYQLPHSGTYTLPYPKLGGSCAAVSCGEARQLLLWPGQAATLSVQQGQQLLLTVILTRRNTFGPLHRFPRKQPYIAPDSFTCDDAARYSLYPTGLLRTPKLYPADP